MTTDELLAFVDKCRAAHEYDRRMLALELLTIIHRAAMEAINRVLTKQKEEVR